MNSVGVEDDVVPVPVERAVLTLRALGMGGDVPNLESTKGLNEARKKLEEFHVAFGDWSDAEVKCAAWMIHYVKDIKPITGGDLRRYSFGVIRHFVHTRIDEWRSTQPVAELPVPFERAFVSIVPAYTEAVHRARELYKSVDDPVLLEGEMLSGSVPDGLAVWAPAPPAQLASGLSWQLVGETPMGLPVPEFAPELAADALAALHGGSGLPMVRMLADFRVNLMVLYEDRAACEAAGGLFDKACGTL